MFCRLRVRLFFVCSFLSFGVLANEVDLYNLDGEAVVYIDTEDEDLAIYTWDGDAVSYLVDGCGKNCLNMYAWEGDHIGFFENGVVYDLHGRIVGSARGALNMTYYAPYAKYAKYAQYAKYARYAAYAKPSYSYYGSNWSLVDFVKQGADE
ncbi:4-fold beta flower protein [Aliivibrio fischeri]|uniref:4-fold beta flower protein n=1 Tax=Aliivibrio fischeri TaxID=668 RepID=UPI001F3122D4|nr:hypothetical protein [Aliivibrio fischeri]